MSSLKGMLSRIDDTDVVQIPPEIPAKSRRRVDHTRKSSIDSSDSPAGAVFRLHKRAVSSSDGETDASHSPRHTTEFPMMMKVDHHSARQAYRQISTSRRTLRLLAHESIVAHSVEQQESSYKRLTIASIRQELRSSWYSASSEDDDEVNIRQWARKVADHEDSE